MITQTMYNEFLDHLIKGDRKKCTTLIMKLLETGMDIRDVYLSVFQKALMEVGALWQQNRITVAQEHLATAIVQSILMMLYHYMQAEKPNGKKVIISCIGRELHEVGARMVSDFFEMDGWEVNYLGANVPSRDILLTVQDFKPDVVGISCTIPWHMESVKTLIGQVKGDFPKTAVAVGGYAFNKNPDMRIYAGADIWAPDAPETVLLCNHIVTAGASYVKR